MCSQRSETNLPQAFWRLIKTPAMSGAWNMALDEALLEQMAGDQALPALRLYAWAPPCLSLGYAQSIKDVDLPLLNELGWEIVRRPTGGRAILHTDELTYSVIGPVNEPRLVGSVLESYQRLSSALLEALHLLNVPAQAQSQPSLQAGSDLKGPACFDAPSNYEITVNGKKLIGSAQARRRVGVLQHGSLPLTGDLSRITRVLSFHDSSGESQSIHRQKAAARLASRATTVQECLGEEVSWESAAQAFAAAFASTLNLQLIPGSPSPAEEERTQELIRAKYGHASWTERV